MLNLAQSFGYDKVNRLISAVWCIEGLGSTGRELAFKVENAVDMVTRAIVRSPRTVERRRTPPRWKRP